MEVIRSIANRVGRNAVPLDCHEAEPLEAAAQRTTERPGPGAAGGVIRQIEDGDPFHHVRV